MKTAGAVLLAVLAILLTFESATAVAEQPSQPSGVPVHMVVTAESLHAYNPPPINRDDVLVYEGRDRDKVVDWVPAEDNKVPLELFVLIDDSSNTSLGVQLDDIRQFLNSQPASAKVGVAYMQDGTALITQNLTSDHDKAAKAIRLPLGTPGINDSSYFALEDLMKRWPESSSRREVLMVSDGIDRFWGGGPDDAYVDSVIEQAQRAGIVVFALYTPGVGHYGHSFWRTWWGQIYLSRVSDETGGESYYFGFNEPAVSFVPYLDQVTHRLAHQYLLTFLAKPEKKAGMERVKVTTELPNTELVTAASVYVPAQPR